MKKLLMVGMIGLVGGCTLDPAVVTLALPTVITLVKLLLPGVLP